MRCEEVRPLISAGLDGELEGVRLTQVRAHLAECCACAVEREALNATVRLLRSVPEVEPPLELRRRIGVALLEAERTQTRRRFGFGHLARPLPTGWAWGAALGAAVAAVALFTTRSPEPSVQVAKIGHPAPTTVSSGQRAPLPAPATDHESRPPDESAARPLKMPPTAKKSLPSVTFISPEKQSSVSAARSRVPEEELAADSKVVSSPRERIRPTPKTFPPRPSIRPAPKPASEAAPRRRSLPQLPESSADSSSRLANAESTPVEPVVPYEPSDAARATMAGMTQMAFSDPDPTSPVTASDDLSELRRQLIDRPMRLPELGELKPTSSPRSGRDGWIRF